jgi:hypothetical protein
VTAVRIDRRGRRVRVLAEATQTPQIELVDAQRKSDLFQHAFEADVMLLWRDSQGRARRPSRAFRLKRTRARPRLKVVAGD